jgi:hypothetical protein
MISRFVGPLLWYIPCYDYMADLQNDMLMWLVTEAKGVERSIEGIARRLLVVNFAGIHLTSMASVDVPSQSVIHS